MIRALNIAERNITAGGGTPVDAPAATAVDAFPNQVIQPPEEIAYRYIQNVGANPLYYAFGQNASPANYNGVLQQYQQLDCSNHRLRVSVYSTAGTTVATTILFRNEQVPVNSFITSQIAS